MTNGEASGLDLLLQAHLAVWASEGEGVCLTRLTDGRCGAWSGGCE
jgi:hypothetical protein